jgi:hypothetical protein
MSHSRWIGQYRPLARLWRNDLCPALLEFEQEGKVKGALLDEADYLIDRSRKHMSGTGIRVEPAARAMLRLECFRDLVRRQIAKPEVKS